MNIAIAGFGLEGKQNYEYFRQQGGHNLTILDERETLTDAPEGAELRLGSEAFSHLEQFDMVMRTAGLAPRKLPGAAFIWSATNEFFKQCPAPIIGVTGTKGKGTTSSFITSILRAAGRTVHLVGNIGTPALEVLPAISPDDIVVYELSSFQLWDLERSPHIAVVLMIEADHLDVHADFAEYIGAKANIVRTQTQSDICVYQPGNEYSQAIAKTQPQFATHAAPFNAPAQNDVIVARVEGDTFVLSDGRAVCGTAAVKLPGAHNLENACAAISACLPYLRDLAVVEKGLAAFEGLDHRLKFVAEVNDVRYYDDSIATTPGSAIAALAAFSQPKVMIMGGSSKGADFAAFAMAAQDAMVRHVVLIGDEAAAIAAALEEWAPEIARTVLAETTMAAAVQTAANTAEAGDVVVLSPACASFGMFKDYKDRGEQFIAAVKNL